MKKFMMSTRFNKQTPSDFNLEYINGKYISLIDGSEWEACALYDFGWGKENGFYKKPLGTFTELIKIVLDLTDQEDSYGATSIIEDYYSNELKSYLLTLINQQIDEETKERLSSIFKLYNPINRTFNKDYSLEENKKEYQQWVEISKFFA